MTSWACLLQRTGTEDWYAIRMVEWWSQADVQYNNGLAQLQQAAPGNGQEGVPRCEAHCHTDRAMGRAVTWGPRGLVKLQCRA